jgi:hypothetical protein
MSAYSQNVLQHFFKVLPATYTWNTRVLVCYMHFSFSYNFYHHGISGAAVDFGASQEDPYIFPCKNVKLIT